LFIVIHLMGILLLPFENIQSQTKYAEFASG